MFVSWPMHILTNIFVDDLIYYIVELLGYSANIVYVVLFDEFLFSEEKMKRKRRWGSIIRACTKIQDGIFIKITARSKNQYHDHKRVKIS